MDFRKNRHGIRILSEKKATMTIDRKEIWDKTKGKCFYCHKKLQSEYPNKRNYMTIDHVIPLSKNGSDSLRNKVPCCKKCNFEKGNKIMKKNEDTTPQEILEWWKEQTKFENEILCRRQAIIDIEYLIEIIENLEDIISTYADFIPDCN